MELYYNCPTYHAIIPVLETIFRILYNCRVILMYNNRFGKY